MVSTPVQGNETLSVTKGTDGTKSASGRTTPGATNWHLIDGGIEVDVDTSAAGFTETPIYVTSIVGDKHHWGTTGGSSVYNPTPTGFSIKIRWDGFSGANPLDIEEANSYKWHINWIATQPSTKKAPSFDPKKYYVITNKKSGKCIDVAQSSTADGGKLHQWNMVKTDNQQWKFQEVANGYYHIIGKQSGKLVSVTAGSVDNGAKVIQWSIAQQTGAEDQKWRLEDAGNGYFYIINQKSNKLLSVSSGSTTDGAELLQNDNVEGENQKWKFEAV